jgi:Protein  of unknown function (DUF3018)
MRAVMSRFGPAATTRLVLYAHSLEFAIVICNIDPEKFPMASRPGVAQRVQKHRMALRAAGLRPVQIWLPDTRPAGFAAECRRQCLALRKSRSESNTRKRLSRVADTEGWI